MEDIIVVRDTTPRTYHYIAHELSGLVIATFGILFILRFQSPRHLPEIAYVLDLWRLRFAIPLLGVLVYLSAYTRRIEVLPGILRTVVYMRGTVLDRNLKDVTRLIDMRMGSKTRSWVHFQFIAVYFDSDIAGYQRLKRQIETETGMRFEAVRHSLYDGV